MGEWERLGRAQRDPTAVAIFTNGLDLSWKEDPPPTSWTCPPSLVTIGRQRRIILSFIPRWLELGFVRELPSPPPFQCHFSCMFSVPKDSESVRPIMDLSPLNRLLCKKHFKMEDLTRVSRCIHTGMWAVKLDLKDAYWHLLLATGILHFFAFDLGDRRFLFLRLPFGLSTAPWAFSRVLRPIKKELRLGGVEVGRS